MGRFAVYRNPESEGYLVDVQADLLDHLNTRVVVPLLPAASAPVPATTLNPLFQIEGQQVVMVTQFMAAIPAPLLKGSVHNLADSRNEITAALDLLFQGF